MDDSELDCLLAQGERFRVDYKQRLDGGTATSIREAVCSFANDLPGSGQPGVVFVGVGDQGEPTGLDITDRVLTQLSDIKTDGNIVPPPSMFVEKRRLKGTDVVGRRGWRQDDFQERQTAA